MADTEADELARHVELVAIKTVSSHLRNDTLPKDVETTPLFTSAVRKFIRKRQAEWEQQDALTDVFPQYGLLGLLRGTYGSDRYTPATAQDEDNLVYANMNAPWSAFICGSQGGGKSHTLSCLLENALLSKSPAAVLPKPLAGLIFHYDKFTSVTTTQFCEAAYLCSEGIPVQVLVSPSNLVNMKRLYSSLPGLSQNKPKPQVKPLYLQEEQLNVSNIKTLMAVHDGTSGTPLYLAVLFQILRNMAMKSQGTSGVKYSEFKRHLDAASFTRDQNGPLSLRLQLLESFIEQQTNMGQGKESSQSPSIWDFKGGSLTIVDLSDPFVSANDACALFSICLSLFMESRGKAGRIVALDEAHKFLTQSGEALNFTEDLVSIIRQQRHLATRVVIATQEPTLSPALLDLCNVTIVHRFLSPAWFETLKKHLAGARLCSNGKTAGGIADVFQNIVNLETGEALLFSPTAIFEAAVAESTDPACTTSIPASSFIKLKDSYIKLRVRQRVTVDGGKSIMASDAARDPPPSKQKKTKKSVGIA